MTFLWGGLLLLLLLDPAPGRHLRVGPAAAAARRVRYSSLALFRDVLPRALGWRRHLPFALFTASIAALVVALSRPAVVLSVPASATTVLLAMDVSGSMCSA